MAKLLRRGKGFTMVELLVVIAIIGVLAVMATVALGAVRVRARDAKRAADIKQLRTALEAYFNREDSYPSTAAVVPGSPLLSSNGKRTFIKAVPKSPSPAIEEACQVGQYLYSQEQGGRAYKLYWCLARKLQDIGPGTCIATPEHMCFACSGGSCAGKCGGHDGCGIVCPSTCAGGEFCDTARNVCIECNNDGDCVGKGNRTICQNQTCVCAPKSDSLLCAEAGRNCGPLVTTDNCGAVRSIASCGSCSGYQTCGGGGTAGVCGCTPIPQTSACLNYCNGKEVANGCGGTYNCSGMTYCAANKQGCCHAINLTCGNIQGDSVNHYTDCLNQPTGQSCAIAWGPPPTTYTDTGYTAVNGAAECTMTVAPIYFNANLTYLSSSNSLVSCWDVNETPVQHQWCRRQVTCNYNFCNSN